MHTVHSHPHSQQQHMQRHISCTIFKHILWLVVQQMQTPSASISHLHSQHSQQSKQQLQQSSPSRVHCNLQAHPSSSRQRFWSVAHATSSSHVQIILQPSAHSSKRISQHGTWQFASLINGAQLPFFVAALVIFESPVISTVRPSEVRAACRWFVMSLPTSVRH